MRQLVQNVFYTRCKFRFTCGSCTRTLYYSQILWIRLSEKFPCATFAFKNVSNFWIQRSLGSDYGRLSNKLPLTKVDRVLKSIFDLNPTFKMRLTQHFQTWKFFQLNCSIFLVEPSQRLFEVSNIVKRFKIEEDWGKLSVTVCFYRQSCAKYIEKD